MSNYDPKTDRTDNPLQMHPGGDCCGKHGTCGCGQTPDAKPAILLVDDDRDYLEMLAEAIDRFGDVKVFTAYGAELALGILRQRDVSLVVADHFMPGMTGVGLLECVKNEFPGIVRVIMSSNAKKHVLAGAINRAHVTQYVPKGESLQLMTKQILRQIPARAA